MYLLDNYLLVFVSLNMCFCRFNAIWCRFMVALRSRASKRLIGGEGPGTCESLGWKFRF